MCDVPRVHVSTAPRVMLQCATLQVSEMFAPYFKVSEVEFPSGKKKKAFHCTDPPGLKKKVFELKKIQDDPGWIPLVGIDKGKKWLKCTVEWLRLLDEQSPPLKKQFCSR